MKGEDINRYYEEITNITLNDKIYELIKPFLQKNNKIKNADAKTIIEDIYESISDIVHQLPYDVDYVKYQEMLYIYIKVRVYEEYKKEESKVNKRDKTKYTKEIEQYIDEIEEDYIDEPDSFIDNYKLD
jgi:hypothetical protein